MTKLAIRLALLAALNVTAGALYLASRGEPAIRASWETDALLRLIPRNVDCEVVVLGTSHGKFLSVCEASANAFESGLGAKVLNLSKNAAGPMPLRLYLEHFYARGNRADVLLYAVDPWVFYNRQWNEAHGFLQDEPLAFDFLARCVLAGRARNQLLRYLQNGFLNREESGNALYADRCGHRLEAVNPRYIPYRIRHIYGTYVTDESELGYIAELEAILALAQARGARVMLVTPPTLLGDLPGMHKFEVTMKMIAEAHGAIYANFNGAMQDPTFFVDHDHLNTDGVREFATNYLKPLLSSPES